MAFVYRRYQLDALNSGEVVFLMDQEKSDPVKENPDLSREVLKKGICGGLTLHWMALRYRDQDFRTEIVDVKYSGSFRGPPKMPFASASIRQAAVNQATMAGVEVQGTLFLSRVIAAMTGYGIPVHEDGYGYRGRPVSTLFLDEEMRRSGQGLYYLGMRRDANSNPNQPDAGGHALAIENRGFEYRMLDANTGCYRFRSRQRFLEFFSRFLQDEKYPEFCSTATWIARIGPHLRNYKDDVDRLDQQRRSTLRPYQGSPFDNDRLHHFMRRPMGASRLSPNTYQ